MFLQYQYRLCIPSISIISTVLYDCCPRSLLLSLFLSFLFFYSILPPDGGGSSEADPSNESTTAIFSGHPHISIVTVYRNKCWMRIPSLGLVEGDIIALMAGDITPGRAFELLPEEIYRKNQLDNILKSKEELYKETEIMIGLEGEGGGLGGRGIEQGPSWSIRQSPKSSCEDFTHTNNAENNKNNHNNSNMNMNSSSYNIMHNINPILTARNNRHRNSKLLEKGTKIHLRVRYPDKHNERERVNNAIINDVTSVLSKENRMGKGNRKDSRTYESTYRSKPNVTTKVRSVSVDFAYH